MKMKPCTTEKEPEDITPFSMIFGFIWKAYDAGELSTEKLLIFSILYRKTNAYDGVGHTSYAEICVLLKRKSTKQTINHVNKVMTEMKSKDELIWFQGHSGSREFSYTIPDFKLALKPNEKQQKWIDRKAYFPKQEQDEDRGNPPPIATIQPEAQPRLKPPEQRSEGSNSGGFTSIGEDTRYRKIRPPHTNTDT